MDVLDSIDPALCVQCKAARALCGINPCPLLQRVQHHLPKVVAPSRDLFGSSPPSLFVGRYGYPNVGVGPMLPPHRLDDQAAHDLDDPASWLDRYSIADVVGMRASLVRTVHKVRVDAAATQPDRITQVSQELAMAARPADVEARLGRVPTFDAAAVTDFTAPHGPSVAVERAGLAENVRVERPIERAVGDTDLRAADALRELMAAGTDGYQLERLLSSGLLGQARQRRLVPTRWAITATDDTVSGHIMEAVRALPTIDKPTVHFAEHFGNRFHVILLPRVWGFENVEVWLKGAFWAREVVPASDFEDHGGRTTYARNTAGGYYATRLAVLEYLERIGRQASAVVLREITDQYTTPLGVWVVRETARRAMAARGLVFEDATSAVRHVVRRARWPDWQKHAPFLDSMLRQRRIDEYGSPAGGRDRPKSPKL